MAALPQEYEPLKKAIPSWRLLAKMPFRRFAFRANEAEVILVECGMGAKASIRALEAELRERVPGFIIFAGFAGGLHKDLCAGDVCVVHRARSLSSTDVREFAFSSDFSAFLEKHGVIPVLALTAEKPEHKSLLSATVDEPTVLDMETAAVAEIACREGIPFACFRAISDTVGDELGFDLAGITDAEGRVSLHRVILTIFKDPAVLKSFYLSRRRSSSAAKNLAVVLAAFLGIPADRLYGIARGIHLECG